MADYTQDSYYVLSLNILKALGGDVTVSYPDADAIWDEIYKIYDHAGGRFDIVPLEKTITENGQYDYYPENDADAFMPVNISVNVPQKYTDEQVDSLVADATINGYNDGYFEGNREGLTVGREEGYTEGYTTGNANGIEYQKGKLIDIQIVENGVYESENGYKTVTVEVSGGIPEEELNQMLQDAMDEGYQDGYAEGLDDGFEDGVAEQKEKLEELSITVNGVYEKEDGYSKVTVNVPSSGGAGKPKIYNGFAFNGGTINDVDFSAYDWSGVYDTSYFFYNTGGTDEAFDNFKTHFNGKMLSCFYTFGKETSNSTAVSKLPDLGQMTKDCKLFSYMCYSNKNLNDATALAKWDTSNAIATDYMFHECTNLYSVPLFDTSNVRTMKHMFYNSRIGTLPAFDTSNVVNMSNFMYYSSRLTTISAIDTSSVTDMSNAFGYCSSLNNVPMLDMTHCVNIAQVFNQCSSLTEFGGFKNLGARHGLSGTNNFCTNCDFTHDSLMNIINNLYDRASAGYSVLTLKLNSYNTSKLSAEEIAIATNKGWTIS